ncbi:hypothetical protein KP509_05G067200 [Ceratopteris richardii]|uniref:Uncharacterized protein n=1 Tax=Ceratopteris richardii TaxID=49495 RepID=A0A8T2UPN8_CERRI|nr:hypothetical protein KP509_05G067200 [Ceratopteris richardii]
MFSSLEALDVDEHVDIAPVTRQGAFIPKAKPRVRKGANHSARIKHTEVIKQTNSPVSIANADEHIDQQIVTQQLSLQSSQLETDLGIQSGEVVEEKVSAKNLNDDVNANVRTITPPKEESTSTIPPLVKEVLVEDFFKTQENLVLSSDSKSEGHAIDTVYALSGGTLSYQQQIQGTCCTEKQEFVEKEHSLSTPISNEDFRGNAHNESLPSSSDLQPLQSECLLAPEGIGQIDLDDYITEINEMQAVEHVNKATIMSPQLKHVSLDLQSPQTEKEVAEVSSKIKIASEDGPDLCLAGNKVRQAHNVGAVEEITTSDHVTEENNNSFDDGNEQQDRMPDDQGPNFLENEKIGQLSVIGTSASGVEVGIADVSCQKSVMDDAAAPVKKKRHGSTPKRKRHDDGEELLNAGEKTSSMRIKKSRFLASSFANVQGSAREVATGTTADREENLEASSKGENKQETDNVQGQQDNGHSSTIPHTEKRRRRKPARYLDAADDDEKSYSLFSSASVKKSSRQSQIDKQGNVETELLSELFPSLPEKIAKLKKRENGSTNATLNGATAHTTAKGSRRAKGSSKSTTPKADKNEKKVFKKPVIQRRRVERCTINPADPDLDPKKLTMKEIIRLAAAKERISKKENAKNAKNKDQIASTDAEIEHENEASACFAPQVQIIDGQIVINEESLVINARRKDDIRTYKRVEETHAKLNYHSYMKRTPKQFWKPEETELFYKVEHASKLP